MLVESLADKAESLTSRQKRQAIREDAKAGRVRVRTHRGAGRIRFSRTLKSAAESFQSRKQV
jgi:hypothetical protein